MKVAIVVLLVAVASTQAFYYAAPYPTIYT